MKRLSLFLIAVVFLPTQAMAAEAGKTSLRLTPVIDELNVQPGEAQTSQVNLTNLSPLPLPVKGYARAFVATDEVGGSDYPDDQTPGAVQSWFSLDQPDFILQPNQTRAINVKIQVPPKAEPGGHYATLFFESLVPTQNGADSSLYLSSRLGALYFFVVAGDIHTTGEISDFNTSSFHTGGPIEFKLAFQNSGNVHFKPQTKLVIKNLFGKKVGEVQDGGQNVLPGKLRRWQFDWKKPWLFGRYTARLESHITPGSPPIYKEVSFWVIPIWQLLALILLAGLFYLLVVRAHGRWRQAIKTLVRK